MKNWSNLTENIYTSWTLSFNFRIQSSQVYSYLYWNVECNSIFPTHSLCEVVTCRVYKRCKRKLFHCQRYQLGEECKIKTATVFTHNMCKYGVGQHKMWDNLVKICWQLSNHSKPGQYFPKPWWKTFYEWNQAFIYKTKPNLDLV